jgi:hypothetical protein
MGAGEVHYLAHHQEVVGQAPPPDDTQLVVELLDGPAGHRGAVAVR